ncbi:efflux RND transporter periplasmic adaptor subunit [Roseateles sp. SL47]|uniref:efflux RND transporter periplasmic adaptor subunit n=1 Tax=Roseateles sp. SL47 TaxID=2995138 RepID=UPI0022714BFD|nr:efflux RND transporter periplasmic adaptor subunit [Roseateles sp. SL47]WAC71919.1 efflux RND transporter periplasmic adaptor subunit [Roseateles sp. SL47]
MKLPLSRHPSRRFASACLLAVAATVLAGCGRANVAPPAAPRTVKLETAGIGAASSDTRFIAMVRQEQRADLAFEQGGRIAAIAVEVGDRVRQGQVLARLDPAPMLLKLRQAEAQLRAAAAQWRVRDSQCRQQQAMFDDGATSRATLTAAESALDAAAAQRQMAEADLTLARRTLHQSEIRAPFDGSVVARLAQPQGDAAAGQILLQLEGLGRPQAVAVLPGDIASRLQPGALVRARRAGAAEPFSMRLRGVSSRLDGGGSAQVILDFQGAANALRSGDSLSLDLIDAPAGVPAGAQAGALTVPLSAVIADARGVNAAVFVYQQAAGRVTRRPVTLGPMAGERFVISAGLKPGEQIVTAGAAFLSDGQAVQPLPVASRLADGGSL